MKKLPIVLAAWLAAFGADAQRHDQLLNDNWQFRFGHQVEKGSAVRVDLPHTWNAQDALSGRTDYKRGLGHYERRLFVPADWKGQRLYLRFEGANSIADLFVNGRHAGQHRGGYGAFVFEITDFVNYGKANTLRVSVNNAETLELMPLVGDFNFYGGLYRDVHLVRTGPTCISLLDHGSSGIRLVQDSVSKDYAAIRALVALSNGSDTATQAEVLLRLLDSDREVAAQRLTLTLPPDSSVGGELPVSLRRPHLWDGRRDPFRYRAEVSLWRDGREVDRVEQPLGLRYYHIDPERGFFLNGRHVPLRGVCRHQDRSEVGNALRREHHDEDAAIMAEMGANAVRLAHYPQAEYFYDLMDRYGFIVWAEIPFVGPGGYSDEGFVNLPAFRQNGRQQLVELIRQHYNHPSIAVWGLFNELSMRGDDPVPYIKELNDLAHREDPTRLTVAASNTDGALNFVTDAMAWNRYDGWYGGTPAGLGQWLDHMHTTHPDLRIAISEYGAGASLYHQQDTLVKTVATSFWHPENWQTHYHMANWREISARPFVWGSFIWNLFDFGAAHRHEGDRVGINDKGLVTFDRRTRKDAFYFYKANWNKEVPLLYLAERRCTRRTRPVQTFMAFTNQPEAELFVNGTSCGHAKTDSLGTVRWNGVRLRPGQNEIRVVSGRGTHQLTDGYTCCLEADE
ncbi:beta-galactosidase [Prevotella sp. CAG:755]|nr:beta-galactosidase [Prevotella sp. CAG:755]